MPGTVRPGAHVLATEVDVCMHAVEEQEGIRNSDADTCISYIFSIF